MPETRSPERAIILNGQTVTYTVRRSARAQRIGLRVTPAHGLEVVIPARSRLPGIPALLRERADWIIGALDRVAAARPPEQEPLGDDAILPYRGAEYRLIVRAGGSRGTTIARDDGARTITVSTNADRSSLAALLEGWFREEARAILTARTEAVARVIGVNYARLTIRDGRSRWGSCSARGGLNFSWRLILAPPAVLDYVVIHELAHRRELNHSPRFWAIVAEHCPDYRLHQRWLRDHGPRLMGLLRPATT